MDPDDWFSELGEGLAEELDVDPPNGIA